LKALLLFVVVLLTGCLTVTTRDGTRISATGNARVTVKGDTITVENKDTAQSYEAIGALVGQAAATAAKAAVKP